jgi:hypothetical protein
MVERKVGEDIDKLTKHCHNDFIGEKQVAKKISFK